MNPEPPGSPDKASFRDIVRDGFESARQLLQPAAFRIAAPHAPKSHVQVSARTDAEHASIEGQLNIALSTLAAVATAIWRARSKLGAEEQVELPEELRNLPRHIQAAWDALAAGKVQIDDPTGRRYVPGMAVNTLTIQPLEGITCELIHETIKPTVYFNDTLIQRADVILGSPIAESPLACTNHDTLQDPASGDPAAPDEKGNSIDGPDND